MDKPFAISIDIDGTIANVSKRLKYAESVAGGTSNPRFWGVFLKNSNYAMDEAIPEAREFLEKFKEDYPDGTIIYLSGRPERATDATMEWLRLNDFPSGILALRTGNMKTRAFKAQELKRFQDDYYVLAHIGDMEDDEEAAKEAGVFPVRIKENEFPEITFA